MLVLSAFQQIWRRKLLLLLCYSVLELLSYIRFLWRAQKLVRHHTLLPPHLAIPKFTSFFISRLWESFQHLFITAASQTEVQPSVPAAGLSSEPSAQCNLVLNDANLLTMISIVASSTGLHRAPKIFMMEACNTTIGEIARQKRDELRACIRQVCCQASADARG